MVDTSKVTDRIQARSQAESPQLRRHRGVVQSMSADGTVGITLDGGSTVLMGVRRLIGTSVNVGDTVEVIGDDTDLFVLGPVHQSLSGLEQRAASVVRYSAGTSGFKIEDTEGQGHSWLPYSNGSFYFTSRPDAGDGKWYWRTYDPTNGVADIMTLYASGYLEGGDENWQAPTLVNGYQVYGSTWQQPVFRREPGRVVRLKGLINASNSTANIMFSLPNGYKPFNDEIFMAGGAFIGGSNSYRIDIQPDGDVLLNGNASPSSTPSYLSLSGITFGAE